VFLNVLTLRHFQRCHLHLVLSRVGVRGVDGVEGTVVQELGERLELEVSGGRLSFVHPMHRHQEVTHVVEVGEHGRVPLLGLVANGEAAQEVFVGTSLERLQLFLPLVHRQHLPPVPENVSQSQVNGDRREAGCPLSGQLSSQTNYT
jgi:hypothetical protein